MKNNPALNPNIKILRNLVCGDDVPIRLERLRLGVAMKIFATDRKGAKYAPG